MGRGTHVTLGSGNQEDIVQLWDLGWPSKRRSVPIIATTAWEVNYGQWLLEWSHGHDCIQQSSRSFWSVHQEVTLRGPLFSGGNLGRDWSVTGLYGLEKRIDLIYLVYMGDARLTLSAELFGLSHSARSMAQDSKAGLGIFTCSAWLDGAMEPDIMTDQSHGRPHHWALEAPPTGLLGAITCQA